MNDWTSTALPLGDNRVIWNPCRDCHREGAPNKYGRCQWCGLRLVVVIERTLSTRPRPLRDLQVR